MPKICLKCNSNEIPNFLVVDSRRHNLQNRKYCLTCSPFKRHNTSQLHCQVLEGQKPFKRYHEMSTEEKKEYNQKTYNSQKTKRLELKKQLVCKKGGKCERCGYCKNLAALTFHHLDPSIKLFEIDARSLISKSLETILKEVDKCQLLCANCHQEIHHPSFDLTNFKEHQSD